MEEQIKQSWWKSNWKWVVPTGGCLGVIIIAIAFISYGAYKLTDKISEETSVFALLGIIQEVQKSPEVKKCLGTPIRFEGLGDGSYNPDQHKNHIDLDFKIQGRNTDAQLRVIGDKTDEGWHYNTFTITAESTGEIIDLKNKANE